MTYPGAKDVLLAEPLLPWIDEHFIRPDPYAFDGRRFSKFVARTCEELGVDRNGVFCLGSGAIGLSLNPDNVVDGRLKEFDVGSDLDIAVVSELFFEQAWRDLRVATQPTAAEVDPELRSVIGWQKKRFFDGAILANVMLPWVSFGREWLTALVRLEEYVAIEFDREIDIHVWIYRDYWSVRNYVSESIIRCRRKVTA
jgi:hypothetical protein